MPMDPKWLDPREDRAWRAFRHASHRLSLRLQRHLLRASGLSDADYQLLAVLSEHAAARRHVDAVRRHLIDLFTPDELDTLAALNERILSHLADEPLAEHSTPE